MLTPTCRASALGLALLALSLPSAHASCGAASCNLLNDRFALGTWDHTGWSADFRFEALTQTQLREGTKNIHPADLPLVRRDHLHDVLDEDTGDIIGTERWHFRRLGDVQALARWQALGTGAQDSRWALTGGLKLPTGSHTVTNGDGTVAERALQPGTGTTDVVLGASARSVLTLADALSLQLTWTQALAAKDDFKPGRRFDLSVGWAHAMDPHWSLLLQANLSHRGRDSGADAEPDLSGSTTLSLSPGISVALGHADTFYALAQKPVYQKVNGIQLVPRLSTALGWTHSF